MYMVQLLTPNKRKMALWFLEILNLISLIIKSVEAWFFITEIAWKKLKGRKLKRENNKALGVSENIWNWFYDLFVNLYKFQI